MPVQHEAVPLKAEGLPNLFDLVDEAVDLPQRVLFGLVAERRAELVVVVVLNASRREIAVAGFEVLVGRARAPVQEKHLQRRVAADSLGPNLEGPEAGFDRHHAHPARDQVVSP